MIDMDPATQADIGRCIAGFGLLFMLYILAKVLWDHHQQELAECEENQLRAERIRTRPWLYEEEAPEPQAGFGGTAWKEAGARLRRQPKV